jgi:hypothetical protein
MLQFARPLSELRLVVLISFGIGSAVAFGRGVRFNLHVWIVHFDFSPRLLLSESKHGLNSDYSKKICFDHCRYNSRTIARRDCNRGLNGPKYRGF